MKLKDHLDNLAALAPSHPDKGVQQNFSNFMGKFFKSLSEEMDKDPEAVKKALERVVAKFEDKSESVTKSGMKKKGGVSEKTGE